MKISILGCGWLGFPLAKELLKKGHSVKGSTTSPEKIPALPSEGVQPYLISLTPEGVSGEIGQFLSEADVLIVNIPPGLRKNPKVNFVAKMSKLVEEMEASGVKKVLLVSSTSVYKDKPEMPVYTEEDKPNENSEAGKQLTTVEEMLMENALFDTCIVRFGGLVGPGRYPVTYLAGRKGIRNPLAPVNLIHLQDCIEIILRIFKKGNFSGIYNAVFPEHPNRKVCYLAKAEEFRLPLPEFEEDSSSIGKIIQSVRIEEELNYRFRKRP